MLFALKNVTYTRGQRLVLSELTVALGDGTTALVGRRRGALGARRRAGIASHCLLLVFVLLLGFAACGPTTPRPQATPLGAAEHGRWSIDWAPATRALRFAIAAAWLN